MVISGKGVGLYPHLEICLGHCANIDRVTCWTKDGDVCMCVCAPKAILYTQPSCLCSMLVQDMMVQLRHVKWIDTSHRIREHEYVRVLG
jgi:hypothetical protein